VTYRRRASPLHAARAAVGALYCAVLSAVALSFEHPIVLVAIGLAVVAAAASAGVLREVARVVAWSLPFALVIALINPIVVREGLTVVARGGEVPVLGSLDITLEAIAYGGILGLRALDVLACFALLSSAVDPDDLLRAVRRWSFRSALTAALATRMVPVLARDARRLADAQRCRAGGPPPRLRVVRAVATGALDRAVDVAATLEVRGYGSARRAPRVTRPWSRHDLAFLAAALALGAVAIAAHAAGATPFEAYPRFSAPVDGGVVLVAVVLAVVTLLPFLDRRGIGR
jgi:energy-coupling factor transport system permease protein